MPCITHHIYAIDFQLILQHANETHVHLLDCRLLCSTYNITRRGLSWIERSFKEHFSTVILSIHCMIISQCVYVSQFWLCVLFQWSLNNVSMQQRSEAIPDTSLPLTKHQQNFILCLSLSFSSSLPPSCSLPLTGSLHVVKFISPGDGWERNKRGGEKER